MERDDEKRRDIYAKGARVAFPVADFRGGYSPSTGRDPRPHIEPAGRDYWGRYPTHVSPDNPSFDALPGAFQERAAWRFERGTRAGADRDEAASIEAWDAWRAWEARCAANREAERRAAVRARAHAPLTAKLGDAAHGPDGKQFRKRGRK